MEDKSTSALTGLRFFAALSVLFWHAQGTFFAANAFFPFQGDGAVQLFFILSGFVLTISKNDRKPYAEYLVARVARIWPLHLSAFAFLIVIYLSYNSLDWMRDHMVWTTLDLLLLQAWVPDIPTVFSFNGVAWSLSVEMFFYLMFPLCIRLMCKRPLLKAAACFVLTIIAVTAAGQIFPSLPGIWIGYICPLTNLYSFIFGISAALTTMAMPTRKTREFRIATGFELLAIILALLANVGFHILAVRVAEKIPPSLTFFVLTGFATPAYTLLIFTLARYHGAIGKFLSSSVLLFLGESSFALYMFHQVVIKWRDDHTKLLMQSRVEQFVCFVLIAIVFAAVAHLLIERPARRAILGAWYRIRVSKKAANVNA